MLQPSIKAEHLDRKRPAFYFSSEHKKYLCFRFEEKSRTIQELDDQLQKLHFSTEALADFRKNLAISAGNVSRTLAVISGNEENSQLSGAIAQLAEVQVMHLHVEVAPLHFQVHGHS